MRRQVSHWRPLAESTSGRSGVLHSGQTRMSRRSLAISMKAPLLKVDCSKGSAAASRTHSGLSVKLAKYGAQNKGPLMEKQTLGTTRQVSSCSTTEQGIAKQLHRDGVRTNMADG